MSNFIAECEAKFTLFVSVHGRKPINADEYIKWCSYVDKNLQTTNSRGTLDPFADLLKPKK
jgi:hypothetical protein